MLICSGATSPPTSSPYPRRCSAWPAALTTACRLRSSPPPFAQHLCGHLTRETGRPPRTPAASWTPAAPSTAASWPKTGWWRPRPGSASTTSSTPSTSSATDTWRRFFHDERQQSLRGIRFTDELLALAAEPDTRSPLEAEAESGGGWSKAPGTSADLPAPISGLSTTDPTR